MIQKERPKTRETVTRLKERRSQRREEHWETERAKQGIEIVKNENEMLNQRKERFVKRAVVLATAIAAQFVVVVKKLREHLSFWETLED